MAAPDESQSGGVSVISENSPLRGDSDGARIYGIAY
jgi:hypothetical protein